jgi:hypothetical protein
MTQGAAHMPDGSKKRQVTDIKLAKQYWRDYKRRKVR